MGRAKDEISVLVVKNISKYNRKIEKEFLKAYKKGKKMLRKQARRSTYTGNLYADVSLKTIQDISQISDKLKAIVKNDGLEIRVWQGDLRVCYIVD